MDFNTQKQKVLECFQNIQVLQRNKGEMEAGISKLKEKTRSEAERVVEASNALKVEKKRMENTTRKICEQTARVVALESEKRAAEEEHKRNILELNQSIEVRKRANEALGAEVEHLKSLSEESGCTITTLLAKNAALERDNSRLEMGFNTQKQKVLECFQNIQVLERNKGEMEAEIFKLKEETSSEAERQVHVNEALKSADDQIVMLMKKIKELQSIVAGFEDEKRAIEDEGKKKASELTHRIEVLNRENKEVEAKFSKIFKEKKTELKRTSKKMVSEKIEFLKRIYKENSEEFTCKNMELEAEVYRVKKERSEEIEKIMSDKTALQENYNKEVLILVSRSGLLERDKRELETEIREKDERIKFLVDEKECLAAQIKMVKIKTNNSSSCKELPNQVLPARNVATLSSLTAKNQVSARSKEHILKPEVSFTGPEESSDSSIQKRGAEGLGDSVAKQAGTKRCKLDGLLERKLVWKNHPDMLTAITNDYYVCMRSVCALYRRYKSLSESKIRLRSPGYIGFQPPFQTRGMVLGELLTSGDPEGGLKKSVVEFEQADPRGLEDCRRIVRDHYDELLKIYNNLDPLFRLGDVNTVDSSS